eukprot:221688_1
MIANIGPASYNYDETVGTLRFASRAKKIENAPHINEDPKDAQLRLYQEEIELLKQRLANTKDLDPLAPAPKKSFAIVVDKVIEKVVHKKGVSEEKVRRLAERAKREKRAITEKMQTEKAEIEAITSKVKESTRKMAQQLKMKSEKLHKRRKDRARMSAHLSSLKHKLVAGKSALVEARAHTDDLQETRAEVDRRREEKALLEGKLKERSEAQLQIEEKYDTQEKELEAKNGKLLKLTAKYQEMCIEVEDAQSRFQEEREEMLDMIRNLSRHLELKQLIIDNFVPLDAFQKRAERASWDPETESWTLAPPDLGALSALPRPVSACPSQRRRPQTEYARLACILGDRNPRYRWQNVVQLSLDMPERTTQDFIVEDAEMVEYDDEQDEDQFYGAMIDRTY